MYPRLRRPLPGTYGDKCISLDECSLCRESCPYDAIKWGKPPEIDIDYCVECGICLNSCTSLLFLYPMLPLTSFELFLKSLRWSGDRNKFLLIVDGDKRMELYRWYLNKEPKSIGHTILHIPRALYFSQYHIYLSLAHGYMPVILAGNNLPGYSEYSAMIKEINNLLSQEISIINKASDIPDFQESAGEGVIEDFISSSHIRMIRSILKYFIDDDKLYPLRKLNLFDIYIEDNKCTFCEACTRKCPTKALYMEKNSEIKISYNPVECIGCGLCQEYCPEDALKVFRRVNPRILKSDSYRDLVVDKMAYCLNCGAPIGPERLIRVLEERMRNAGVDEEHIKAVRYCKKCKTKLYFKSLYKKGSE